MSTARSLPTEVPRKGRQHFTGDKVFDNVKQVLLSPTIGIVNQFLRTFIPVESDPVSIYNLPSIAILQGLALTPMMFFMVSGAFQAVDPAFEEAAEVSGASKLYSLRRITLPLNLKLIQKSTGRTAS